MWSTVFHTRDTWFTEVRVILGFTVKHVLLLGTRFKHNSQGHRGHRIASLMKQKVISSSRTIVKEINNHENKIINFFGAYLHLQKKFDSYYHSILNSICLKLILMLTLITVLLYISNLLTTYFWFGGWKYTQNILPNQNH